MNTLLIVGQVNSLGRPLSRLYCSTGHRLGAWQPPLQPIHRAPDISVYLMNDGPDCPSMVIEVAVEQSLSSQLRDQTAYSVNPEIKMFLGIKVWRKQTEFSALVFLYHYPSASYLSAFSIGTQQIDPNVILPDGLTLNNAQSGDSLMANLPTGENQAMMDLPTIDVFAHVRTPLPQNTAPHVTIDLWMIHENIIYSL